jgi:DNA double-strand break repair helicase HerA and related ATPase
VARLRRRPPILCIWGKAPSRNSSFLRLANRHGLITGATGTGKTVTLQGLAEGFSDQGVPVFCADVKSDLSGLAEPGEPKPWIEERAKEKEKPNKPKN